MTDKEAIKRIAEKLRRAGASIPAPEVTGTIEGSVVTGLCIALALVEAEIEALTQPEQEPVPTLEDLEQEIYQNTRNFISRDVMEWMLRRYYTTPPQRKPLTDEQVISKALHLSGLGTSPDVLQFARAIEAAHGIKENT
jgi:hypothetical protein